MRVTQNRCQQRMPVRIGQYRDDRAVEQARRIPDGNTQFAAGEANETAWKLAKQ